MRCIMVMMVLILPITATLAACASSGKSALPVCDGKHLRAVNLHGSVLETAPPKLSENEAAPRATPVLASCGR